MKNHYQKTMELFKLGYYTDSYALYKKDPDAIKPLKPYGEWLVEMAKVMVRQEENERAARSHTELVGRVA